MSLGTILKDARERKGLTISDVAEQTHLLPQMVEEIEQDDFHRFAAAIYGRGFIRLYAECVGENPEPLVQEFSEIYSGARRPVIATRPVKIAQEKPPLVESSTAPSGRPRVKTRVVETAPEEAEPEPEPLPESEDQAGKPETEDEPGGAEEVAGPELKKDLSTEPAPVDEPGPSPVPEQKAEEEVPEAALGDLFNQSAPGKVPVVETNEGKGKNRASIASHFHLPFSKGKSKKKSGVVVPFDPFVDEPQPNPVDGPRTPVLAALAAFFTTPGGVITGIAAGVVVVIALIVSLAISFSNGTGKEPRVAEKAVVEAFPADATGRPASFSTRLLPPPDSYAE